MDRLVSSTSVIPHQQIRNGAIKSQEDFNRVDDALTRIHNTNLWLCDTPNIPFEDLRNEARMFRNRGGEVVIVDYMTLVRYGDSRMPRPERVGLLSSEFKALARELEVPLIVLSQLNRESETSRPSLATIRQSGEIEENADMIILLHRERESFDTDCIVAKHRNGPTGTQSMRFNAETLRFCEVEQGL
jgi:replicative DNA helicase